MKLLVTGSIAYDVLLHTEGSFVDAIDPEHLSELSMAFVTPRLERHYGGTGANIAWNMRLLNQQPVLVGTVGNDGGAYTTMLQEKGIDTTYIQKLRKHVTATAIVGTDADERQITFFHPGADAAGTWPDLQTERPGLMFGIVSPRDVHMMAAACQWCEAAQVPYLFDPGQQVMQFGDDELQRCIRASTGVICNAYEWELFSQKTGYSIDALLKEIKLLIVSHGEEGVTAYTPKEALPIPACRAEKVLNPTGAGDALRAGILTGLGAGWQLRQALQLGASLASFVVEQEGALVENVDVSAVLARAQATYGEALPVLP